MTQEKQARILIVDDEPELRELLADALEDGALSIETAGSAKEALELAESSRPDLLVTDLCLGDSSGLDVIDNLRKRIRNLPAVVITGHGDAETLTEASRRRPVELMTKPLNLARLRETIWGELDRQSGNARTRTRAHRLRRLIRTRDREARRIQDELRSSNTSLAREYRALSDQSLTHQQVIRYQNELIAAKTDDDVFRAFFRTYVRQCGSIYGAALVCDSEAQLRVVGRFGVPKPDSLEFCKALSDPLIDVVLSNPEVQTVDCFEEPESFEPSIQRYLPGLNALLIPLIPAPGEMIGMVMLYRKGEQPFVDVDFDMAEILGYPTALAVRRND